MVKSPRRARVHHAPVIVLFEAYREVRHPSDGRMGEGANLTSFVTVCLALNLISIELG